MDQQIVAPSSVTSEGVIHLQGLFLHKAFEVNDKAQVFQAQNYQLKLGIVDIETHHL